MRTFQTQHQSHPARRGASSSSITPLSTASITLTALLLLSVPLCTSAPTDLQQATSDQRQILSQIDAVCSSYLSADLRIWASDVLGELCVLMLVQKSKGLKVRAESKRGELPAPGGIQNKGFFLYRPRNGRRSLEYE